MAIPVLISLVTQPNTLATQPTPKTTNTVVSFLMAHPYTQPQFPDYAHNALTNSAASDAQAAAQAAQQAADALAAQQAAQAQQVAQQAQNAAIAQASSNWYENWIYNEESGDDPTRWNTSGCLGLGQACPASKLLVDCPNEDYACEEQWFTSYMLSSYGSWQAAYEFHIKMGWW